MKKIIIFTLLLLSLNVQASTKTYPRTEDDLRINSWITVTEENKWNILQTPSVDENEKIYDFADLLTPAEEEILYEQTNEFIENNIMDIAIVTTDNNYSTASVYADDFYDYNNFGIGNNRAGILILIDMDNREFYISTTGEAILIYNDARIDSILDDMTPYMKNAEYYEALKTSITDAQKFASQGIPEDNKDSYINEDGEYVYVKHKTYPLLGFILTSGIVSTIILLIFINKNKLIKKAYNASEYLDNDTKNIRKIADNFITSNTTKIYVSSNSGGSYSGGSSTHSSSSGSSHGGGGRSF